MTNTSNKVMEYPLDRIYDTLVESIREWQEINNKDTIRSKVHEKLDKNFNQIIMLLLGFEKNSWGNRWEVDHCNGRKGESSAGDYLKRVQKDSIEMWFKGIELPPPTKIVGDAVRKEYKKAFINTAKNLARTVAREDAQKFMLDTIDEFSQHTRAKAEATLHALLIKEEDENE